MNPVYKNFLRKDPLSHKDAEFINVISLVPRDMLIQLDKSLIQHSLDKARRVCQWLEGILEIAEHQEKEK